QSGNSKLDVGEKANTKDGEGGGGSVSVGAALAVNVANSSADASTGDDLTINAGGALSLKAANNMDASAIADGSAAIGADTKDKDGNKTVTTVGVAVALNIAEMTNKASLGDNVTVNSEGFVAEAVMKKVGDDETHTFLAKATSGASGGDTGVAGSFALNYSTTETLAVLPGSTTLDAGSGDITIKAGNNSSATVEAGASAKSGSTGVGVSVGINIATGNTTESVIADGAQVTGGGSI